MDTKEAIKFLEKQVKNLSRGLPEEIFFFVSRLTPMVNVDLLIKDENGRTLLAWRKDQFTEAGWHLPGGIIRFKEKLEKRIMKVAEKEIGVSVKFNPVPIAINQVICNHRTRGHFISILYQCFLSSKFIPKNTGLKKTDNGYLKWYSFCPKNIINIHKNMYKKFLERNWR